MRVGKFVSVAGKYFNPIVGPGIMRGRDDNAGGMLARSRQVGHARSRNYPRTVHFATAGSQSERHPVCDPGTRLSRVLSNHNAGSRSTPNEVMTKCAAYEVRAFEGQGKFAGYA